MYQWYKQAAVCLVYLSDVDPHLDPHAAGSAFRVSRWFTRGWTLQELLAPSLLVFYDRDWGFIGTGFNKKLKARDVRPSLAGLLTEITGIPEYYVAGGVFFRRASVAQRMSWAASRNTTRLEDEAYCLLGLFAVNIPLVYGEGRNAFQRLQEEIMRETDDHSLFAWGRRGRTNDGGGPAACFARAPSDFAHCGDVYVRRPLPLAASQPSPFRHHLMTNRGLLIDLKLLTVDSGDALALLNCSAARGWENDDDHPCLAVHLVKLHGDDKTFYRVRSTPPRLVASSRFAEVAPRSIYITKYSPDGFSIPSGLKLGNITGVLGIVDVYPADWKLLQGRVYWTGDFGGESFQVIYVHCVDKATKTDVVLRITYDFEVRRAYRDPEHSVDALMDIISSSQPSSLRPHSASCTVAPLQSGRSVLEQLALASGGDDLPWKGTMALGATHEYSFPVDRLDPDGWSIRHRRVSLPRTSLGGPLALLAG